MSLQSSCFHFLTRASVAFFFYPRTLPSLFPNRSPIMEKHDNKPLEIIYHVRHSKTKLGSDGKPLGWWTRIGAVWPTKKGVAKKIDLSYFPTGEGLMISMPYPGRETEEEAAMTYEPDESAMDESNPF